MADTQAGGTYKTLDEQPVVRLVYGRSVRYTARDSPAFGPKRGIP